jgi:peroxiredoxin
MTISVGANLPETTAYLKQDGKVTETSLAAWSAGRKVVLIIVPGAFTPTCSVKHLPGYVEKAAAFAEKGIEAMGCLAVNDVHVMAAWGDHVGAGGKVDMIADPGGAAANEMGILTVDVPALGNVRAARLALVAEDGVVTQLYMEEPAAFEVSAAEHVLERL